MQTHPSSLRLILPRLRLSPTARLSLSSDDTQRSEPHIPSHLRTNRQEDPLYRLKKSKSLGTTYSWSDLSLRRVLAVRVNSDYARRKLSVRLAQDGGSTPPSSTIIASRQTKDSMMKIYALHKGDYDYQYVGSTTTDLNVRLRNHFKAEVLRVACWFWVSVEGFRVPPSRQ